MELFILRTLTGHVNNNQGIRPSQHGFMKGRSCLTNLISFYDQVTLLVDERKAEDIVYLDFNKAFELNPVGDPSWVVFPRAQSWGQPCLISLSTIWMRGL